MAKNKINLSEGEKIIKTSTGGFFKSKINVRAGKLILTDKRLVFQRNWNFMFGLLGLLLPSMRGGIEFDIQVENIKNSEKTKFGLNKNILAVKTNDGKEYKISLSKNISQWLDDCVLIFL